MNDYEIEGHQPTIEMSQTLQVSETRVWHSETKHTNFKPSGFWERFHVPRWIVFSFIHQPLALKPPPKRLGIPPQMVVNPHKMPEKKLGFSDCSNSPRIF